MRRSHEELLHGVQREALRHRTTLDQHSLASDLDVLGSKPPGDGVRLGGVVGYTEEAPDRNDDRDAPVDNKEPSPSGETAGAVPNKSDLARGGIERSFSAQVGVQGGL